MPLIAELSETNRTIAVSLRHYYPEKWNGKGNDLSLQQHAGDMAAFIKALNVGPVNLLGHSRGGAVALLTASQHPELIKRLILAEPAPLVSMVSQFPGAISETQKRQSILEKMNQYYRKGDTEGGLRVFVNYIAGPKAWSKTADQRRKNLRDNVWTQTSLMKDFET